MDPDDPTPTTPPPSDTEVAGIDPTQASIPYSGDITGESTDDGGCGITDVARQGKEATTSALDEVAAEAAIDAAASSATTWVDTPTTIYGSLNEDGSSCSISPPRRSCTPTRV